MAAASKGTLLNIHSYYVPDTTKNSLIIFDILYYLDKYYVINTATYDNSNRKNRKIMWYLTLQLL